jgi:hypothetical protein
VALLTPAAALAELLARVGAAPARAVALSADELAHWPADAVAAMKAQGVLRPGKPGDTAVCPGCEQACVMQVQQRLQAGHKAALFIVCDKPEDIGRVPLAAAHLERWRVDGQTLGDALSLLLGGCECQPGPDGGQAWRLGAVAGRTGKSAVHLRFDNQGRALLDVAGHALELGLLLAFHGERLVLDARQLARCVDAPAQGAGLAAETAEQRTDRLRARRAALQKKGVKAFLQVLAQEEEVSVSMVKKILRRSTPDTDAALPAWAAVVAPRQGVSPGKKNKH